MAYITNDQLNGVTQQDPNTNQTPTIATETGAAISPNTNILTSGSKETTSSLPGSGNSTQTLPGNFTTLQQYINANSNGGANVGGQLVNDINTSVNNTNNTINQQTSDFANQVKSNTNNYDPNLTSAAANNASQYITNSDLLKELSGSYSGPQTYSGSAQDQQALKSLQDTQDKASLLGSTSGQQQELSKIYGTQGQTTSTGGLNLDEALLQNDVPTWNKVSNSTSQVTPLSTNYNNLGTSLQQQIANAMKTNQNTQQQALNTLSGGITSTIGQITAAQKAAQAARDADTAKKNSQLISSLPADVQSKLQQAIGLGAVPTTGFNPNAYIIPGTAGTVGTADVATPQQLANLQALSKLTGNNIPTLSTGTAASTGSFNNAAANAELQAQIDAYNKAHPHVTPVVNATAGGAKPNVPNGVRPVGVGGNGSNGSPTTTIPVYSNSVVGQGEPQSIIGRRVVFRNEGGGVNGPGTGTSDSIPAMLSKGEYVIPADVVKKVGKGTFDQLLQYLHTKV